MDAGSAWWGSGLAKNLGSLALAGILATAVPAIGTAPGEIAGYAQGLIGTVERLPRGRAKSWSRLALGGSVEVGDTVRTGLDGRVRLELTDRDEATNSGPSVLNLGPGSEVVIERFQVKLDDPVRSEGIFDLIRGTIRSFMKGWGSSSSVNVRAGVAVCGIRGSEQVVRYSPEGGPSGEGVAYQANLAGEVFTTSRDPSAFPGDLDLETLYQRRMTSPDPRTWVDIRLTAERVRQLIGDTELPDNRGRSEEARFQERFGRRGRRGAIPVPPPLGGGPCRADVRDVFLNGYPWSELRDVPDLVFYRDELAGGRFAVWGRVDGDCPPDLVVVEVSLDGGRSWVDARYAPGSGSFRYEFDPAGYPDLDLAIRTRVAGGSEGEGEP